MDQKYKDFIKSPEWREKRREVIQLKGNSCEKCGRSEVLDVHHKNYDKEFGMEDVDDLMVLCQECHKESHQDKELFDNPEMKGKCPECKRVLIKNKCFDCGISIENEK